MVHLVGKGTKALSAHIALCISSIPLFLNFITLSASGSSYTQKGTHGFMEPQLRWFSVNRLSRPSTYWVEGGREEG